jgi:hypothetical protein
LRVLVVKNEKKLIAEARGQFDNFEEVGTSAFGSRYQATVSED